MACVIGVEELACGTTSTDNWVGPASETARVTIDTGVCGGGGLDLAGRTGGNTLGFFSVEVEAILTGSGCETVC